MALIADCRVCGERISLRKMRAGQYVAFEVGTDVQHEHVKKKSPSKTKKQSEPKKIIENKIDQSDSDEISKTIFEEKTMEAEKILTSPQLRKIETSREEKKSSISLVVIVIVILAIGYWYIN
tara:strand:+ start:575 stop:940 length:366 start_codon:yes stop_codon:yes gene_type:complete